MSRFVLPACLFVCALPAGPYAQSLVFSDAQRTLGSGFAEPNGVAVDGSGNVYVAGTFNRAVKEMVPVGVAVDGLGDLFISSSSRVIEVPADGGPETTVGTGLSYPEQIAVDGTGDLFVADTDNGRVLELPAAGGLQSTVGSGLTSPTGVAVDAAGDIFVADTENQRPVELPFSQPPSLTFTTFNSIASAQTVTLENIGNLPLALPGIEQQTNPAISDGSFVLNTTRATACAVVTASAATAGTLTPGDTCALPITFSSTNGGTQSGTLVLTDNSLNASPAAFTSQTIALSGTANSIPDITWTSPVAITYGTPLSATQLNATANWVVAGSFTYAPVSGTVLGAGTHTLSVTFTPVATDDPTATTTVTLTVNKAVPAITWATPASITYGTLLSATQLGATSPVAGNFVYDPPAGTGFPQGSQTLSLTFTPTDTADYTTVTDSVQLTVNQISQTITFTQPASPVAYGVSPITLSAIGGASGNPVTFSILSGPRILSGTNNDVVTVAGAGTIAVAANQAGNTDFAASTQVTRSVVVNANAVLAALTSPTPGGTLAGSSATFMWTTVTGATDYALWLGTTGLGSNNLWGSGSTTANSVTFGALPTNAETIDARLWTTRGGVSTHADFTYTAASQAAMRFPVQGSTFTGTSVTFTWTAATGAATYDIWLGSTGVGSNNLGGSGATTATSLTFGGLPTNGEIIYVRLWTTLNGSSLHEDYTYTAASQAAMISPTQGSTLTGSRPTFTWTAATGATKYDVWVGSTGAGSNNLGGSGGTTSTSYTIDGLPTNGEKIYVRLFTFYSGGSVYTDYTYTAY